ncbi:MAG TPA: rhodanese-like domain-containing protein [Chloroflexus aurantiacus]|uniref:Rhodanese domain protein n=1 Tax=Chloroflexus aurantiacus (strain ATCC 29366 / DSM 635 / J-10-fl) TaxID=324602 RepID=A9WC88_CHLAA|nr:rhodanese-like domain-containing protein [Chloroflexus aurantiacus]ABY33481.1 Rhodanese domain protein [Chloroflexus aurantiacus J-10-fl]RMG49508.1 MAG: rhodanese-like domain-containing protein [Chloroflexota bacterium]HBW66304.1 rhodanese-like domain-containing protein [Chloroflexus aurantiacus]
MFRQLFRRDVVQNHIATMTVQELKTQLDARAPMVLIDVRQPEEFAYDGHVSGARLLPLPVLASRLNELPKDQPIVCICRSGNRSQVACEMLQRHGFTNVTNVVGGMVAWQRAGYPVSRQH